MDDLTANFDELLSEEPEEKEVLFDFKDELQQKKYKIEILRYYNGSPVIYEEKNYIVLISNRNLTIVNTHQDADKTNHCHVKIKTNKQGVVNLNLVKYLINVCINKKYPQQEWMTSYLLRLTIDENYKSFLIRKRNQNKQKQSYKNKTKRK